MLVKESKFFVAASSLVESCLGDPGLSVAQRLKAAELALNLACIDAGLGRLGWFAGSAAGLGVDRADRVDPADPVRVSPGKDG